MIAAYREMLNSNSVSAEEKHRAAHAWTLWEGVASNLNQDVSDQGLARFKEARFVNAHTTIENHYFYHGGFLDGTSRDQNALLAPENVEKMKQIPTYIVHGKYDQVCPVRRARDLRDALITAGNPPMRYVETEAGHSMFEEPTTETLVGFMDEIQHRHRTLPVHEVSDATHTGLTASINILGEPYRS